MALFKTNQHYSVTPGMVDASGQFVVPAAAATANFQVANVLLATGSLATSQLTPIETVSPQGTLMPVFCSPNGSVAAAAGNNNNLPRGLATTAQTAGSEFVIDCSAFAADIISAQAAYMANVRGAQAIDAVVSAVDNINKLIYIQVVNRSSGAVQAATAGAVLSYQIVFKDTFTP